MYRLLLVDDEEIEREGMARSIPWEQYEVELVGAAWNGIEALKIIKEKKPDIVLTDIKMPVMDGIGLIREAKKIEPNIAFIVLSGYGEYEFTSQAMEEGIRHYVLKPCDEKKIVEVLERVKDEIRQQRLHSAKEADYQNAMRKLLPRAKEQVFRNLLLGREQMREDYLMFLEEMGDDDRSVAVLAIRSRMEMDALEQFIIGNILGEFLGEGGILMSTFIRNEILFLLDVSCSDKVQEAFAKTRAEFAKLKPVSISAALSREAEISCIHELYQQVEELFRIGDTERQQGFLHYGMFKELKDEAELLMNYQRLTEAREFDQILFECYLAYLKMKLKGYSLKQMEEVYSWTERLLYGDEVKEVKKERINEQKEPDEEEMCLFISRETWALIQQTALHFAEYKGLESEKEEQRMRSILLAIYRNLNNPEISIQYLAKHVLFMNEDHFGRIFARHQKKKFSTFLLEQRVELAEHLIQYDPETRISDIAKMVGYPPDGQYFSKMFKKVAGVSPSEYKEQVKPAL